MRSKYSMLIQWSDEDQVYICSLPEFGEFCKTHGSTYEEAAKNGREVIEMMIDSLEKRDEALPQADVFDTDSIGIQPPSATKRTVRTKAGRKQAKTRAS